MPFPALKDYLRRRQLTKAGIVPRLQVPTWSARARSGVWTVIPDLLSADSVVYSVGVGDNISWDLALIERFGLTVHAFDPTPRSIAWLERQSLPATFHFHPVGVADRDGVQRFQTPRRGDNCNYLPSNSGPVECEVRRLATLARQLGHRRLDLLKLDIEGNEYSVVPDLLASRLPVRQLLIEVHHNLPGHSFAWTCQLIRGLEEQGYQLFHISKRGLEFAFLWPDWPVDWQQEPDSAQKQREAELDAVGRNKTPDATPSDRPTLRMER